MTSTVSGNSDYDYIGGNTSKFGNASFSLVFMYS